MAPRTRSMRVQRPLELAQGLPCLPDDLYFELLSQIPVMPLVQVSEPGNSVDDDDIRMGHLTLCSLSQTCQSLRRFYLPHVWRRIEVFESMQTVGHGPLPPFRRGVNPRYAKELVRQLEVVTVRNPDLAQCVKILNIVVVEHSCSAVVSELARCISLLPNLHTVKFESKGDFSKSLAAFAKYRYPQVRHVYTAQSGIANHFISSCTSLTRIMSSREWYRLGHYEIENQPKLEFYGGYVFGGTVDHFVTVMKSLQDISIDPSFLRYWQNTTRRSPLLSLQHLRKIRIRTDIPLHGPVSSDEKRLWIHWARNILRSGPEMTSIVNGRLEKIVKEVLYVEPNGDQQIYEVSTNETCEKGEP